MTQKQWQHFSTSELNNQSKELVWLEFGSQKCDCEVCLKGGECKGEGKTNP